MAQQTSKDIPGLPNANDLEILTRIIELIGLGNRRIADLAGSLELDPRTISYYLHAARWLGWLERGSALLLTDDGLDYLFAGERRAALHRRSVLSQDHIRSLLVDGQLPSNEVLAQRLLEQQPGLSPSTVRRRCSSVRGLVEPALTLSGVTPAESPAATAPGLFREEELIQPLPVEAQPPELPPRWGASLNPELLLILLRALRQEGELSLGQLGACLAPSAAPLGAYVDWLRARGDAILAGRSLVVTPASLKRRVLTDTPTGILLSEAGYRSFLGYALENSERGLLPLPPRELQAWHVKIFGSNPHPRDFRARLDRILLGRQLRDFPLAQPQDVSYQSSPVSFLYSTQSQGGLAAFPLSLRLTLLDPQPWERVQAQWRSLQDAAWPPQLFLRRKIAHGGLLFPGEYPPLRLEPYLLQCRLCSRNPWISMITALLLHQRSRLRESAVLRSGSELTLHLEGEEAVDLLQIVDELLKSWGWVVCRDARRFLQGINLVRGLTSLGLWRWVGDRLSLEERFLGRLTESYEGRRMLSELRQLGQRVALGLEQLVRQAPAR